MCSCSTSASVRIGVGAPKHNGISLILFVAWDIVWANLKVAAAVLGPRDRWQPAVVAVPLEASRDDEIAVLANLVTLTPGSLTLGLSPDRRTLYVQAMAIGSPESARHAVKKLERRLLEAFR